jgi:hypothetical protein
MTLKHPHIQSMSLVGVVMLEDARRLVEQQAQAKDGTHCPCCGQLAKVYTRRLNSALAQFLIWIVRSYEDTPRWIHIREFPMIQNRRGGGDFAKLTFWNLLEQHANEDDKTKRTSGYWKPTQLANDFVHKRTRLPEYVQLYDNHVQGFAAKTVDIEMCLGQQFDYKELMSR